MAISRESLTLFLGPLLAAIVYFSLASLGWEQDACWTAAITTICATWWIFEPIPIPATSLIPIAALPLLGILSPAEVGASYGSPLVLLLMGGFILSTAMEKSGAHRRVALTMVNLLLLVRMTLRLTVQPTAHQRAQVQQLQPMLVIVQFYQQQMIQLTLIVQELIRLLGFLMMDRTELEWILMHFLSEICSKNSKKRGSNPAKGSKERYSK